MFLKVLIALMTIVQAAQSLSQRVAILGSGISGSSAARRLAENGLKVTVFEGGFGAGGRTSTRITRDEHQYQFDHGAQYIGSPKTKDFEKALLQWKSDGFVKDWSDGNFFTAKANLEVKMDEKKDRFVGYPKMSSICENLLKHENINLVTQTQARASLDDEGKWKLIHGKTKEDVGTFDWLIASDRNSANGRRKDLSSADVKDFANSVRKIKPIKSLTAMVVFDKPLDIGMDGVLFEGENYGSLGWIARDSSKPGRERDDGRECWVIQTNPDAAKALLEGKESLDEIREIAKTVLVDDLLKVLPSLKAGIVLPEIQECMGHRWGAAFPINTNTEYAEMDSQIFETKKFVACGDYFGKYSGRIEGAYLSGISAADKLINATT